MYYYSREISFGLVGTNILRTVEIINIVCKLFAVIIMCTAAAAVPRYAGLGPLFKTVGPNGLCITCTGIIRAFWVKFKHSPCARNDL